jgi:hypothetical protein
MAKVSKGYSLEHSFQEFKKTFSGDITYKEYREICYQFNKMIVEEVLDGKSQKLPHSMGMLWIKKFKMNYDNPPLDFKATREAGKNIYHLNIESDGWCGRWNWTKRNERAKNMIYYHFKPTWSNSRACAAEFKKPGGYKKFFVAQIL